MQVLNENTPLSPQSKKTPSSTLNAIRYRICSLGKALQASESDQPPPSSSWLTSSTDIFPVDAIADALIPGLPSARTAASKVDWENTGGEDWEVAEHVVRVHREGALSSSGAIFFQGEDGVLGRGTYGEVQCLKHKPSGTLFAVKTLRKELIAQYEMEGQSGREMHFQLQADHPNLLKCFACLEDDEGLHLVMEYCDGGDLYQLVHKRFNRRLDELEAFECFMQLANGLSYMHSRGFFHRDIKLENLMLLKGDRIILKLADFGWIGQVLGFQQNYNFCGTMDYLSPEMLQGLGHDWRVDIWDLGVILYELLSGSCPFYDSNPVVLVSNILHNRLRFPKVISSDAQEVIRACLKTNPDERLKLSDLWKYQWVRRMWGLYIEKIFEPCRNGATVVSITIGFIGCGQMAQALARGFVKSELYKADQIILSDVSEKALQTMKDAGFRTTTKNEEASHTKYLNAVIQIWSNVETIILAVKPQLASKVLDETRYLPFRENLLLISICAGVTLRKLEKLRGLVKPCRIARVMPNVCCLDGNSATTYSLNEDAASCDDGPTVEKLFNTVGKCWWIPEYLMDIATAVASSAPAFIFMLLDAIADAGVKEGLPRSLARELASQMVLGSAAMAINNPHIHLGQLKDNVCSPGGATIEGVIELENEGFRTSIISAIIATKEKATELGEQ